jgi:hypothetical protein
MSVMIESTDELLALLGKMNLKVTSVDELRHLLASINATYNADAARQKTGKLIGVTVPCFMAGAAALASFFLLGSTPQQHTADYVFGGLAMVWGAVALVSTAAVIAGAVMASGRRGQTMPDNPPDRPVSRGEPVVTHITRDLPS